MPRTALVPYRDVAYQRVPELPGGCRSPEIARPNGVLIQGSVDSLPEPTGQIMPAHVCQHHRGSENQRKRVRDSLAGDVGSRTMNRFEYGRILPDVRTGSHPKASDQPGDFIGENVAKQIRRDDDIELPRIQNELHGAGIHNPVFRFHASFVGFSDFASGFQKHAGERFQDVGLMDDRYFLAPMSHRVIEGKLRDSTASRARIDTGADRNGMRITIDGDVVFESDVEALRVFANRDEIDVLVPASGDQSNRRTHISVQVKLLTQTHIRGTITASDRCLERPLQRETCAPDTLESCGRQRISAFLKPGPAGLLDFPFKGRLEGFKDTDRYVHDFGADSVSGNQGRRYFHEALMDTRKLGRQTHRGIIGRPAARGEGFRFTKLTERCGDSSSRALPGNG